VGEVGVAAALVLTDVELLSGDVADELDAWTPVAESPLLASLTAEAPALPPLLRKSVTYQPEPLS
jgi:hypothetical protein